MVIALVGDMIILRTGGPFIFMTAEGCTVYNSQLHMGVCRIPREGSLLTNKSVHSCKAAVSEHTALQLRSRAVCTMYGLCAKPLVSVVLSSRLTIQCNVSVFKLDL